MSDRLARHGLPHQTACPFCNQDEDMINHLLVECVFAREVWTKVCAALGTVDGVPSAGDKLAEWCTRPSLHGRHGKMIRAIYLLDTWELWKHRNSIVFDGMVPCHLHVLRRIASESAIEDKRACYMDS